MNTEIINLVQSIKETPNPTVRAQKLSFFLSDGLKNRTLNLYEAYLLHWEIISAAREGYTLPAWHGKVQISTCLRLLNQKLLALAFNDTDCIRHLEKCGMEALQLCGEKRPHYIMDRYRHFILIDSDCEDLLQELLRVREAYDSMPSEKGPFHMEVFPYHYFAPEKILLRKADLRSEKNMREEVEFLLIELNT